ncbi:hypothetical protein SLS62_004211 [Diatrype stigma]|uniref:Uncharacterized protein n=1 Tax=Diatrype stigma TaxID=117547 RepID=A0AAN9YTX6_9PEZI
MTYDANFEQVMRTCGVYPTPYRFSDGRRAPMPKNFENMRTALLTRRSSLSSDDLESMYEDFEGYCIGKSESHWKQSALPLIKGNKTAFNSDSDVMFTNLDPFTERDTTVRLKPDFYDGAAFSQVHPTVSHRLNKVIVPTRIDCKVICPNFFMEIKNPAGDGDVLKRQVMHGGAIGARAMHGLRNYGNRVPKYDDKAYAISATYQGGRLMFFAHHVTPGVEPAPPEYFMTFIKAFEMLDSYDFPGGVMAFRNARDGAKSTRDRLIKEANQRASFGTTIDNPIVVSSANSADIESNDDAADQQAHIS